MMTKTADVKELASHLDQWIKEVSAGHEVVVTQNDQPIAKFVAANTDKNKDLPTLDLDQLPTLPGQWIGDEKIRHGDMAEGVRQISSS